MRLLLQQMGVVGSIAPERVLEIANAYLVGFFGQYLKGTDSNLLSGASSPYPEVQLVSRGMK